MTAMRVMPGGVAEWTVHDLDALPDDGLRYELLDGILLVSPAPTRRHQRAVFELGALMRAACPPEMEAIVAPLDWRPDIRTSLQPDVLVLKNRDLSAPVDESMILAVEVLSPSTRRKDAVYKRSKYEDARVQSCWIVDPEVPSILALELVSGRYVTAGAGTGDEPVHLDKPFPVTVVPAQLLR